VCLLVETLGIPTLALGEIALHVDLEKSAFRHEAPGKGAVNCIGGDESREHDVSQVVQERGNFRNASDVLRTVVVGEAEIAVETVTEVVTVQACNADVALEELPFNRGGERGLAGSRESGEPDDERRVAILFLVVVARYAAAGPGYVG
jgi:hypothetical protein